MFDEIECIEILMIACYWFQMSEQDSSLLNGDNHFSDQWFPTYCCPFILHFLQFLGQLKFLELWGWWILDHQMTIFPSRFLFSSLLPRMHSSISLIALSSFSCSRLMSFVWISVKFSCVDETVSSWFVSSTCDAGVGGGSFSKTTF